MKKNRRIAVYSMFACIIIVLQIIATYINIGGFPITLTLVPIIVAGVIYGVKTATICGLIFGGIVFAMVILGFDPNSMTMFIMNPVATTAVCFVKGGLAGLCSALAYKWIRNKNVAIVVAAGVAPIVNTSTFCLFLFLFFDTSFAASFSILISLNFFIEFLINVLIAPALLKLSRLKHKIADID